MNAQLLFQLMLLSLLLCVCAAQDGGERPIGSAQFSPDGKRIGTASCNGTARIWDATTGKPRGMAPDQLRRNKAIIARYFEEWADRGNTVVADELLATNLVLRNPPAVIRSLEDYKNGMAKFHAAFPGARYTVEELIAERDKVVARWMLRGKQAVDYQGHTPNGKTMTVTGASIFRLAEGKIQEIWVNMDRSNWAGRPERQKNDCFAQNVNQARRANEARSRSKNRL